MKHDITKYTTYWNLFKDDAVVGDFQDYSLLTLTIEMRKHFTEAATERSSSNLCLAAIIKIIWNVCQVVKFSK